MTDWNHTTDSNAEGVTKIQEHRDSHRCSLLSKRWHCKAATSPLGAVEKAGQSPSCKVGRTTVGTQRFTLRFGQVQALSSGDRELQGIVDGVAQRIRAKQCSRSKRHRTRTTESSRIEFSTKFAYLLAKWLISYEDDHITEKPQPDNKTARKSTDPAYMNKLEQQLRVTSAYNPVLSRELDE